ncbi:epoxide hydrolase [Stemphylium lycopersici]|uniref:Epoxide hydrolase n=1 Tax=Stemphylium lycopersici TaxID=183478 RepID=A0A364MUH8_STELY|nr:epoxide hydrolase [Stemphylium lycopersici]RAR03887.1 epoxide hydrolase [Stemphylium lycopersici]
MSYSPPDSAKPFTLNVSEQDMSEWRQLLQLSKLAPETWEGRQEDHRFGVTHKWLSETKDYWLNKYDWRAAEKRINSFPNYKMQIENVDMHFVALFSEKKDAIPIIFMHGWPGSFIEFLPMVELIKKKYSAKDLPYHIVVPSLPGYTLSKVQSSDTNWTLHDSSRVMNQMMLNLGFDKYLAQGGDVGSFTAQILNAQYDACLGIHLNMISTVSPPDQNTVMVALEKEALGRASKWRMTGSAYAQEHGTRTSTIGHVISSNPLAILAWIGEKLLEWSDEKPSLDEILTNISLYWFTGCFATSLHPYRMLFGPTPVEFPLTKKPLGFSFFPYELMPGIKSILEKETNLVFYKRHERGGHFAALERPSDFLEDVEEFVGKVWKV